MKDEQLTREDTIQLSNWLDSERPPATTMIKNWQATIAQSKVVLDTDQRYPLSAFAKNIAKQYGHEVTTTEIFENLERTPSIQPVHYKHLFRVTKTNSTIEKGLKIDKEVFNTFLFGSSAEVVQNFQNYLQKSLFDWEIQRNMDHHRTKTLHQIDALAKDGWGAYAYPESAGGHNDLESYAHIFENLIYADASLAVKFGVQFGLFGGSIHNLGNKTQRETYLKASGDGSLLGCFAMTETGHGSNVRGINTTATYLEATDEIVIHTPNEDDNKEYIGNALHAKIATVFAQLIVQGKNQGVAAVLVPLRDENHSTLPGITIKDNGYKIGLNGVDNGKIWFNEVKVPASNLLSRFGTVENGVFTSSISNPNKRFFTMLGTLVGGRICVAKGALAGAKLALSIAATHALKRRQFSDEKRIEEALLLDYPTHQMRLLPKIASCYVYHIALKEAMQEYVHNTSEDKRVIETQVAGLKSIITWFSSGAIQEAREACGGKGYLLENKIGDLRTDLDIFTTFEGDNTVLLFLTAKGVLTDFKTEFNGQGIMGVLKFIGSRLTDTWASSHPSYPSKTDISHLDNPKFHEHALEFRLKRLTYTAAMRIRKYIKSGMPSYNAFLKTQTHLVEVGKAYANLLAVQWFNQHAEQITDSHLKTLMFKTGALHGLSTIRENAEWYLESGYIQPVKSKAIRTRIERLSATLRTDIEP